VGGLGEVGPGFLQGAGACGAEASECVHHHSVVTSSCSEDALDGLDGVVGGAVIEEEDEVVQVAGPLAQIGLEVHVLVAADHGGHHAGKGHRRQAQAQAQAQTQVSGTHSVYSVSSNADGSPPSRLCCLRGRCTDVSRSWH